jgi:hypothetical protein
MMYDYFLHRIWKDFARFRKGENSQNKVFSEGENVKNDEDYRQLKNVEVQLPIDPDNPEEAQEEEPLGNVDVMIEKFDLPHLLIYQFNNLGEHHI